MKLQIAVFLLGSAGCWALGLHASPRAQAGVSSVSAPQAAASSGQTVTGSIEDAAAELTRLRAEQQKAWQSLNLANPLSADSGKGALQTPVGTDPFAQLNRLLSRPEVQAYLRFFNNPIFARGVDQVIHSPQRMTLLYAQLGFMLLMIVFRAWRFSKSSHWLARLWTRVWTTLAYFVGALVVVPWVVLGDPYFQVVSGALDVALTMGGWRK